MKQKFRVTEIKKLILVQRGRFTTSVKILFLFVHKWDERCIHNAHKPLAFKLLGCTTSGGPARDSTPRKKKIGLFKVLKQLICWVKNIKKNERQKKWFIRTQTGTYCCNLCSVQELWPPEETSYLTLSECQIPAPPAMGFFCWYPMSLLCPVMM